MDRALRMDSGLSGRHDGGPVVEDCMKLDLAWLMRLGPIQSGQAENGEVRWSCAGTAVGSIRFRLDLRESEFASLTLDFQSDPFGGRQRLRQTIRLASTAQPFGGRRWWMRCPVTGRRARVLYLPPGGDRFASREVWGLVYASERLSHFDRPFEKLFRLQRKLRCPQSWATVPERPKGMWRRTYGLRMARFEALDGACAQKVCNLVGMN